MSQIYHTEKIERYIFKLSKLDDLGLISPEVTDVALPFCKWKEIKKIWEERSAQFKEYIAAFKPN